jgi:2-polyprenyl-3-methyl-5-hydroxy-6-metoxy-1,4-benzoquinol methylase
MISALAQSKTILDFGAGTGDFANTVCKAGFKTFAFEPNDSARLRIAEKYPEIKLLSELSECKPNSIGIITTWHVMEHVHQLEKTLQTFHSILESNGTLVIAVPNSGSFDAKFYGSFWAAYDVPRHLYHFQPNSIESLLKMNGFILTQIKPMWFDSYYVSLLSESYKSPSPNIFQKVFGLATAFLIGSISNIKTLIDTKHCSSVVYIFKKG